MACSIVVGLRQDLPDPAGQALIARISSELGIKGISKIRVLRVYSIDGQLSESQANELGKSLFSDPINQCFSVDRPLFACSKFNYAISVGFRPGVKDNAGDTSKQAIEELLKIRLKGKAYTSKQYLISGKIAKADAEKIAKGLLANELIETFSVLSSNEFGKDGFGHLIPRVEAVGGGLVKQISLSLPDRKLAEMSKRRLLALSLAEMKAIKAYFAERGVAGERKKISMSDSPTDVELEALAQTWSEHCKHKIFNAKIKFKKGKKKKLLNSVFKSKIKAATEKLSKKRKWLLSVFEDNAGIFEFVPGWNVAMKVETHNTPSALDPFGGALTGILGVNRDVLGVGLGSKPIFNTDIFCFAEPDYKGEIPPRLLHPRRVLEGVRAGVEHGGNASGIPTINGALVFDERYLGKPLVYCGTCGIMPAKVGEKETHKKQARPGDRIFMVGGRIGKDGIHGATFSSVELDEASPVSAVQLGDPYTQKKMTDFLLEARDNGLYNAITDNGAGGLSSSVGEMAQGSAGCMLHLDRAPLKYSGLDPWEIFLSESQERMTVAVPPAKAGDFVQLANLRDVEVSDLGEFNSSGFLHVKYGAKSVAYLDMKFLHNGLPQMELNAELKSKKLSEPSIDPSSNIGEELVMLLQRPNICSKEYVIRQYDHEVQGSSVIKPLCGKNSSGPSDAGVVAPLFDRKEGLVSSNGICPRYVDLDAYQMAANAVDEALRNYIAVGGSLERICSLDNFCWSDPINTPENPEGAHRLAQLVLACQGLYDACIAYGMPLISGKDSMKNDYKHGKWKISIPPTLLVTAIGKINNVSLAVTSDFKSNGDLIYIIGETKNELGGSEYYSMKGLLGANVPKVNFKKNFAIYKKLSSAISKGLVASCHDCSDGGIGVAIAECCIGGNIGAAIDFGKYSRLPGLQLLFSESSGRFIVSVKKKKEKSFRAKMRGIKLQKIGTVSKSGALSIDIKKQNILKLEVCLLEKAWKKTMGW